MDTTPGGRTRMMMSPRVEEWKIVSYPFVSSYPYYRWYLTISFLFIE